MNLNHYYPEISKDLQNSVKYITIKAMMKTVVFRYIVDDLNEILLY